jgi:two-component system, cell cycle sensor histidine kinase and response regulator CckA
MMPGGNTNTTIAQLHSIDPNVQIIIMSGLSAEEIACQSQGTTMITSFLAKPFSTQDLLHALKLVA